MEAVPSRLNQSKIVPDWLDCDTSATLNRSRASETSSESTPVERFVCQGEIDGTKVKGTNRAELADFRRALPFPGADLRKKHRKQQIFGEKWRSHRICHILVASLGPPSSTALFSFLSELSLSTPCL